MIHIRQVLVGKRGNYWYKDTNERQAKTLCGAAPTDRDVVDTKNGLEWLHEHKGCAECAKLARWAKK